MENKVFSLENVKSYSWRKILSGTFLIAGTTIGAGMLGIPLATAQIGFLPALAVTVLVWAFMLCTGLLFLEVILAMPSGNNILSLSGRFLGSKGRLVSGGMFLFLYYCLMVAYFAAGAPLFASALNNLL
ncbi:MAG TPA: aromatic amino acid transport family protein, partial [Rhabdochlamydiaceae bacterium]|nr:aromatic amino acid transport family protein [Rhabdochlamydiaceae bacterium]